jgi:L-lactate utilization protein LutB
VCPAYGVYGSGFGINSDLGGRGVIYSILSREASTEAVGELDICLTCRKCQQNCPLAIDTPSMITSLRLDRRKGVLEPHLATAYDFVGSHINWIGKATWLEMQYIMSKLISS